jgi:hypothetical protein
MRLGYDCLRKGLSRYSKQVVVVGGLMALPITTQLEKVVQAKPTAPARLPQRAAPDPRTDRLKKFLARLHCPVTDLASDFVHAADDNHLDWRLLPSISVIESGGGKAYKNNNIFGWNNGEELFPTIRAGLNEVAFKLGKSPLYRNLDSLGKLRLYNPDESYPDSVITVMNRISPVVDLKPASRLIRRQNEFIYATD